jgi:hypothetical protein
VDILPDVVVPSWRNDKLGSNSIMKRMDRVFVMAHFSRTIGRYRSWVAYPYISDYVAVMLQRDGKCHYKSYPFKLNPLWLREDVFSRIVHVVWKDQIFLQDTGLQRRLVWKLKYLKNQVKLWALHLRSQTILKLEKLEEDMQGFYQESSTGLRSREVEGQIKTLEKERISLLLVEEERWRQHNRATWIKSDDQNTKLFHHFSSYRRNRKQVWEVQDERGHVHSGQEAIKDVGVNYFKGSNEDLGPRIANQVHLASLFPCSKEELWKVLKDFAKDKSPGPYGWTVEFFLHFFELVGEELLEVVEDSRRRGEVIKDLNSTFLVLIPKVNKPTTFGDYRPIALCNLCYKIIAKILANRIKPVLSRSLSGEQLDFCRGDKYWMP